MLDAHPMLRQCHARTRAGRQCQHAPMLGQQVCHMHGGKSPQALAKAEDRMRALIHPAVSSLARLIERDDLRASTYVLDWAGFKATVQVESSGETTIHVVFDDVKLSPRPAHAISNGAHG